MILFPTIYNNLNVGWINLPDLRIIHRRKHKIIVNPKKTELGLEEVEYVGNLVSHKGISF